MREILNHLFEHKTLTRLEAEKVLTNIAQGNYSESEICFQISDSCPKSGHAIF